MDDGVELRSGGWGGYMLMAMHGRSRMTMGWIPTTHCCKVFLRVGKGYCCTVIPVRFLWYGYWHVPKHYLSQCWTHSGHFQNTQDPFPYWVPYIARNGVNAEETLAFVCLLYTPKYYPTIQKVPDRIQSGRMIHGFRMGQWYTVSDWTITLDAA